MRYRGEEILNFDARRLRNLRRDIQVVFQDPYGSFNPRWKVERLVADPFHLMPDPPAALRSQNHGAALQFASAERIGGPVETQIIGPYFLQELKTL